MKKYRLIVFIIGSVLLFLRVFLNNFVTVDATAIVLYFIISLPVISDYVKSAKVLGSEFNFKDSIELVDTQISISKNKLNTDDNKDNNIEYYYKTFDLSQTIELLEKDHVLALASLRIEIERKVRLLGTMWVQDIENKSLTHILNILIEEIQIVSEEFVAIKEITKMCNRAIHGENISLLDAKRVIKQAQELDKCLSSGYSLNIMPISNYKELGYCCEYEHCMENMPFSNENDKRMCPVFGHFCPGGYSFTERCRSIKVN